MQHRNLSKKLIKMTLRINFKIDPIFEISINLGSTELDM